MSVELRCPDCRAKLRLPEEPEPGSEVECPECDAIFPAPDLETGDTPDARPKKKAKGGDGKPTEAKPKAGAKGKDKTPRKRKAKKKETNTTALIAVILGAVVLLIGIVVLLAWWFTRKPASYEMMKYLPADSNQAVGVNVGHLYKYGEFVKKVEPSYRDLGFFKALEAVGTAMNSNVAAFADYTVEGWGKSGAALVIRTKQEFDPEILKKLPGAQAGQSGGSTFYSISGIPKLFGGNPLKAFAPNNRMIVLCEYNIAGGTFSQMMAGNPEGDILPKRLGALGKQVTRGTFWQFRVLDNSNRWQEPTTSKDQSGGDFMRFAATSTAKGAGEGFKASLGSRAVRFEYVLWFENSDIASELYKASKTNEIHKAIDDSSLDPPKWWKEFAERIIGNKKVAGELMMNLGAKASGDLFIIKSECETIVLLEALSGLIQKMTGQTNYGPPPAPPGGGGGGGGGANMPMPGPMR